MASLLVLGNTKDRTSTEAGPKSRTSVSYPTMATTHRAQVSYLLSPASLPRTDPAYNVDAATRHSRHRPEKANAMHMRLGSLQILCLVLFYVSGAGN